MYALVHKDRVLAGPMDWNRAIFDGNLQKLQITFTLPRVAPAELPLVIDADTSVRTVEQNYPAYNSKIQHLYGPLWDLTTDKAIANYEVHDNDLEGVKVGLKAQVAAERYRRENLGTTTTVNSTVVTIDTARDSRNIFIQKYLLMADAETVNWKFPEGWVTLTKADLGSVIAAGAAYVQGCFDWEKTKGEEIDACTTLAAVDAVVIIEPTPEV